MRLGLVGWGIASGNGGMNTDIACLSEFVTKWLIPKHPKLPLHDPYVKRAKKYSDKLKNSLSNLHAGAGFKILIKPLSLATFKQCNVTSIGISNCVKNIFDFFIILKVFFDRRSHFWLTQKNFRKF